MGIYAAVTRRTLDGAHPDGWVPEQKISVAEAVRAYTAGSAYAEGQDAVKGTLEPGKLADIVVLSDDIFAIDPAAIEHVRVDATLLGGQLVFKRGAVPDTPKIVRSLCRERVSQDVSISVVAGTLKQKQNHKLSHES